MIFSNHQEGANIVNTNMTLPNGRSAETGGTRWNTADLDPSEALVFWLGMVKNDPRQPLNGTGDPKPLFPFKEEQFVDPDGDGWLSYAPADGKGAPYVYFRGIEYVDSSTGTAVKRNTYDSAQYTLGTAVLKPYKSRLPATGPIQWANRETYQIISGGLDGEYGTVNANKWKLFPQGLADAADTTTEAYAEGDWDNIANFSDGKIFRDWLE
jgi:hypothetical protein